MPVERSTSALEISQRPKTNRRPAMDAVELQEKVNELGKEIELPGASVGVLVGDEELYGYWGVTSLENPLPVDESTLFQFGSTGKTYTATAMLRLAEQGKVDMGAPVRTYVPELRLKDPDVAERVTVLQLFNHTAGWQGDMLDDTGNGDDALAVYVARMENLEQVTPVGTAVSYNNASLCLAGRVIEKVTGTTFEQAIRDLLLDPLGMRNTWFFPNEIMTRRFAVGHDRHGEGQPTVSRPWALPRSGAPAGGMSANARDQIAWARFHLGDGTAPDGTRLLSEETLRKMREPTADMKGSALGDAVGISWLLRDVDGVRVASHGGTTNGQLSAFDMVPERGFAVISMTNCSPDGRMFNERFVKWALERYAGVVDRDPEPVILEGADLAPYEGRYETLAATVDIRAEGGRLSAKVEIKPEMIAVLSESGEAPPEQPPFILGLLGADRDDYVVAEGDAKGMKGFFVREPSGEVSGVHLGGRLASRVKNP
jgi:CubicO group peptidase (beta-lactamase class C family)